MCAENTRIALPAHLIWFVARARQCHPLPPHGFGSEAANDARNAYASPNCARRDMQTDNEQFMQHSSLTDALCVVADSEGASKDEPAKLGANSDHNAAELSYNGSLNAGMLYGLPPVIPSLYSNPAALTGGQPPDAAAMARLSAGLNIPAGWPTFGHPQAPPPFPPASFPGLFGAGFHPFDFSAMRLPHTLPTGDLDLKGLDPRAVLSAYMNNVTNGLAPPTESDLAAQAEKFKAAAQAMYGRGLLAARPPAAADKSPAGSPVDKTSNGVASPQSSRGSNSISPSPPNSNNNSNMSTGKGAERTSSSGSAGRPSPVPQLKNIERMVEGLNSGEHLFVPTSSSVAT